MPRPVLASFVAVALFALPALAGEPVGPDAGVALPAVPSLEADKHFSEGTAAMKAKNVLLATAHFLACLAKDTARVDCHWELGWAYYLTGDWEKVVAEWETVKSLDPKHEDL